MLEHAFVHQVRLHRGEDVSVEELVHLLLVILRLWQPLHGLMASPDRTALS